MPIGTITVRDGLPETRQKFFKLLDTVVWIHANNEDYVRLCREIFGEKMIMAFSEFEILETRDGRSLRGAMIHVNKGDFVVGNKDYSDLIPLVIFHEKVELWNAAGRGIYGPWEYPESDEYDLLSHRLSLLAEYTKALQRGVGQRHIRFMEEFVRSQPRSPDGVEFLHENRVAYETARRRWQKKNGAK